MDTSLLLTSRQVQSTLTYNISFFNNSLINTIGLNFITYAIFESEELIDEYFSHKLNFDLSFGAF